MGRLAITAIWIAISTYYLSAAVVLCPRECTCGSDAICTGMTSFPKLPRDTVSITILSSKFQRFPENVIRQYVKLKTITFQNSSIEILNSYSFSQLNQQLSIKIFYCEIGEIEKYAFHRLKNTKVIEIKGSKIIKINSNAFYELINITGLQIYDCRIGTIFSFAISNIGPIIGLSMEKNYIVEFQSNVFHQIRSLGSLFFASNKIRRYRCCSLNATIGIFKDGYHYIYDNQFHCDCDLADALLGEDGSILTSSSSMCYYPKGYHFTDTTRMKLQCEADLPDVAAAATSGTNVAWKRIRTTTAVLLISTITYLIIL